MINAEFLQELKEQTQPTTVIADGRTYSTAPLHNLPLPTEPGYPTVPMFSLDSLIEFIKQNPVEKSFVNADYCAASYCSEPVGENRKRDMFAQAKPNVQGFNFGIYMDLEAFRIALLTQFADSVFRVQVLQFVAKVTDSSVKTSEDDGTSQTVTVKQGIASYGAATVPSPVTLQPIRTFIEVEQPEGKFLLRLKQQEKGLPLVGVFELHTNWQRAAAMATRDYLVSKGCPVPVFA